MSGRSGQSQPDRGQTLPDFVVGIAIFLLVVAFTVGFIPQLTAPYAEAEQPAVADRIGADLTGSLLAETDTISAVDEGCTEAFFVDEIDPDRCQFEDEPLNERLGISERYAVNITLTAANTSTGDRETLCASNGSVVPCSGAADPRLSVGPAEPAGGTSVATTRRTMHVDGEDVQLTVRVWKP